MDMDWITLFREANAISVATRLLMAVVCGGVIGYGRERQGRPAGLRTHILVCLGACLAMLTNQYLAQNMPGVDPGRIGAQVVSGIGFLGIGTIIVTGRQQVKGLTTAAGLWASACMGLAIGIGFYEAAIIACLFIWLVVTVLRKMENYMFTHSQTLSLYIEFCQIGAVGSCLKRLKEQGLTILDIQIHKTENAGSQSIAAIVLVQPGKGCSNSEIAGAISQIPEIEFVEVL